MPSLTESAARLLRSVEALTDLRAESALPGWTRAHVLTHVAQAADSRTGLLRAAQAGRVGEQYASEEARAEAIEAGASRPSRVVRADLERALEECLAAIRSHPDRLWDAPAIWLGGRGSVRGVPGSLRRELEYHHVDLGAGYGPADWPGDFVATELARVAGQMDRRDDAPPMTLAEDGRLRVGGSPSVEVTGPPEAMLAWLSGRGDGRGLAPAAALPAIPPLA